MKRHKCNILIGYVLWLCALFLGFAPVALGDTEAYTDPDGELSISGDAVECDGTWTIPIEKTMTLTAINLEDEDINDCNVVDDEITNPDGIKWEITSTYGSFDGGDTGSPKDWTANDTTATGVALRLKIKDAGNHHQDWDSHQQVASINFDIVIPTAVDEGTPTNPGCTTTYGDEFVYPLDSVSHSCAALDFSGLHLDEDVDSDEGCSPGQPDMGSGCDIGAGNELENCEDTYGFCTNTCPVSAADPNCTEVWSQIYYISDASNVVESVTITWTFSWNGGDCDVDFSRT